MLVEQIISAVFLNDFDHVWFQQDGAHFGLRVRRLLDETFPNRWIERCETIEWPPIFLDLIPLDFFNGNF